MIHKYRADVHESQLTEIVFEIIVRLGLSFHLIPISRTSKLEIKVPE